jgi:Tfp pilus assembly protein PilO
MKPSKADAIGFLMLVCVAGLGYFGIIHQQNQRLASLKQSIAELTRVTLANEGLGNLLEHEAAEGGPVRDKLEQYTSTFVAHNEIDQFLRRFASQAEESGVSVSLLRPEDTCDKSWCKLTPINVNLEGAFGGMYRLVREIEAGSPMATLESLRIQAEPGRNTCRASLTFNLYHKPDGGV